MSIYKILSEIQAEIQVPKTHYNKFGDYNYRNCEDILDAAKPLLKKHGCTLVLQDDVSAIGNRYYVKATAILTEIETSETIVTWASAREDETKAKFDGSQLTGSASSYARKYALNGLFNLDDVKDSDTTNQGNNDKPETDKKPPKIDLKEAVTKLYTYATKTKKMTPDQYKKLKEDLKNQGKISNFDDRKWTEEDAKAVQEALAS